MGAGRESPRAHVPARARVGPGHVTRSRVIAPGPAPVIFSYVGRTRPTTPPPRRRRALVSGCLLSFAPASLCARARRSGQWSRMIGAASDRCAGESPPQVDDGLSAQDVLSCQELLGVNLINLRQLILHAAANYSNVACALINQLSFDFLER